MTGHILFNLKIPRTLSTLIDEHLWVPPSNEILQVVFGETPSQPAFYSRDLISSENESWRKTPLSEFLGAPDPGAPPGDIDPLASLLIGDLGPDLPFGLDYRVSDIEPRVVFLGTRVPNRWITIAQDFGELASKLGLSDRTL